MISLGGLQRWWEQFRALPTEAKPLDPAPYDAGEAGNELLAQAMAIYQQQVAGSG